MIKHTLKNDRTIQIIARSRATVRGSAAYWIRHTVNGQEYTNVVCDYDGDFPPEARQLKLHYEKPRIRETYRQTPPRQPEAGEFLAPGMEIIHHCRDGDLTGVIQTARRYAIPICQARYVWNSTTEDAWAHLEHVCNCPLFAFWSVTLASGGIFNNIIAVGGELFDARSGERYTLRLPKRTTRPVQLGWAL